MNDGHNVKYEFVCVNDGCRVKGVPRWVSGYILKYDKALKKMIPALKDKENTHCSVCGQTLQFIEVKSTLAHFNLNTFKGLPDEQKKEILKKRFDKDMVKGGGRDEKEFRKKKAIEKFIGYDK